MSLKDDARKIEYPRLEIFDSDALDSIRAGLGLSEGDLSKVVFDGKVTPSVLVNTGFKVWMEHIEVDNAAHALIEDYFWGFSGLVFWSIPTAEVADWTIYYSDVHANQYDVKTAAGTQTSGLLLHSWEAESPADDRLWFHNTNVAGGSIFLVLFGSNVCSALRSEHE